MRFGRASNPAHAWRRQATADGFSLLEVLVALLLLSVGLLAIVKSVAALNRMLAEGAVETRVAVNGASAVERMRALGCTGITSAGDTVVNGIQIQWKGGTGAGTALLRYALPGRERIDTLSLSWWCQ